MSNRRMGRAGEHALKTPGRWTSWMDCVLHSTRLVCLALIPIATAGCGIVLVHGPPSPELETADFTCTESNAGPVLDVLGVASGIGLVALAAASQSFDDYFYYVSDEFAASGVTAAVLFSISAYVGFRKTKRCREAKERLRSPAPETSQDGIEPSTSGVPPNTTF